MGSLGDATPHAAMSFGGTFHSRRQRILSENCVLQILLMLPDTFISKQRLIVTRGLVMDLVMT
jgi:hypothetical protein